MYKDESFDEFYAKLNGIVNSTYNLGKIYDQLKIVRKILKSLIEDFRPKVTVITESKDMDSKSIALKSIDDVDDNGFDDELSSKEIAYLVKSFRNFFKNNNKRARGRNNVEPKNSKKNELTKINNTEKSKEKVGQSSSNSLGQQCFGFQGYGHEKSECPIFLRSKGKSTVVNLSDSEASNHESRSDENGNFFAFTAIAVVNESDLAIENPSDRNSLVVLTCKKLIISYARLLQKMR